MADQDDFTFDEQDSDSEEWYEEEEPKKKKKGGGSRSRLLLLLLLLVVLGGGAYYYFMILPMDGPGPAAPPKAVVSVKKPVAMPERKPVITPAPAAAPAPAPVKPGAVAEKPTPQPAPAAPDAAPLPKKVEPQPNPAQVTEKPAPAAMPVSPPVDQKQVFEKPAEPKPVMQPAATGGAYTLTAGTYLLDSSIKGVSKKIRALGYEPVTSPVKRKVTMTRLKVGTYSPAEAAAKKAELKPLAPGVFGIKKGSQESVYVGSFAVLDKARRYADTLYAKGIRLTEEKVEVEQTLQRVSFGSFADADAAADAGRQAAAKGVEAKVMKNR